MADYSELKRKAQEIRDEVKAGANTANRVGLALEEAVNALEAENQRAEQAEQDLENAVQLLQDETEDLQSIRDEVERLGSEKADKSALEATDKEVSKKQDKLEFYKEDPSNGSVEIFAQDVVSMTNDSQGGVSCVKVYNEEDTEEGLIPVARMSADKENGDYASVTVWGNEVHIDGDAVKINGVDFEDAGVTIVNDLTTGGADKALSAEMGKELGKASIVDLGETTLEAVNARMREDALPSAERRTMVYKWRFADGGSGFGLSVARLTGWGYCQYRAYKAVVEYRTVSGSGTPSNWLAWSGTHIKYDPATRKIGLAKWSDTGNETIQNSGETAELPLATDSQDGLMSKTQAAKLSGAASSTDLAKKQDKLQRYKEDLANFTVKIREYTEISLEVTDHNNIATVIVYNKPYGNMYIPIARLQSSYDSGGYAKFEARGNEAIIEADYVTVNEYDLMEVIEGYMNDEVELLGNGNIKLTLKGTTKEFMPATPSGDPLHYAYESAGAEWNDTEEDITKTITIPSWQNFGEWITEDVVHKSKCYMIGTCGDLTSSDMAVIYNDSKWWLTENSAGLSPVGRYSLIPKKYVDYFYKTINFQQTFNGNKVMQDLWIRHKSVANPNRQIEVKVSNINYLGQGSVFKRIIGVIDCSKVTTTPMTINPVNLEYINIINLKTSLIFRFTPNISKDSIKYMIVNANPTSAITITLHADRYAQLAEDADIVAALEAKNTELEGTGGSISLVSA